MTTGAQPQRVVPPPPVAESKDNKLIECPNTHMLTLLCLITFMPILLLIHLQYNFFIIIIFSTLLMFISALYIMTRPKPVYLIDYYCYRPPEHLQVLFNWFIEHSRLTGGFTESSLEFQRKILERSGLGEETSVPAGLHLRPPSQSFAAAREEAEAAIFDSVDSLFNFTDIKPKDIGILIVNCSMFNPTPSLSSMIVNKYKFRSNVKSFNLGGMGCSAGVIAIDLAKDMLQVHRNTFAVVVTTENITQNWYCGNMKSMMVSNCLFRVGGAAILLSNKPADRYRAKYKLVHTVRTHCGANDEAFRCVSQEQDEKGKSGIALSKNLMVIAGEALKANIKTLGPLVLPISEQLLFFMSIIKRKLLNKKIKPYIPNFKLAFEHFCIHAGGRAVIDELEKNLQLLPVHVEASRMTLYRFGNTSSSSIWYELAYIEAKGRMRKGHRVWQIAFGSGFKCNSVTWKALQNVKSLHHNPWADCIHRYPVQNM